VKREHGQNPSLSCCLQEKMINKERKKGKTPDKGTTEVQTKDNAQKLKMHNGEP
jgi:hypothetical protein